MDVRYINPFLRAVQNVFDTMINVPFTLGKPMLKTNEASSHEVSGVIGISGEVSGCVVISLSKAIALQMASALLEDEIEEVNADCTDAIGEVANMIAGNAKNDFPKGNTSLSVPSVVIGNHKVVYPTGLPVISIPCETNKGSLAINVALKENSK